MSAISNRQIGKGKFNVYMEIVLKDIDDVIPYKNNPRDFTETMGPLKNSIERFGFRQPIVIDGSGIVVIGHARLQAAKELGYTEVPVHIADNLSDKQIKSLRLADNRIGEIADWDLGKLAAEIEGLKFDVDLTQLGFIDDELDRILDNLDSSNPDEDSIPEVEEKITVSEKGKIYQLGDHLVACGDNTDISLVNQLMDGTTASLLLTDPPYGVSYTGCTKGSIRSAIANDEKQGRNLESFLSNSFSVADSHLADSAIFYIWFAASQSVAFYNACTDNKFSVRAQLVWVKNQFTLSFSDYKQQFEPCIYGWRGKKHKFYGEKNASTVLRADKPTVSAEHPTMKPVELFRQLIYNSSKRSELVLDIFAGSGTTVIACEQTARKARVIEYEPKYVDVIRKRWAEFRYGKGCNWENYTPVLNYTVK